MRLVLFGDGESPHLEKWVRALAGLPELELWLASSRRFSPSIEASVDAARRLALATQPRVGGGNLAILRSLPRLASWLRRVRPDWINAHYLSSHGTLAWLAQTAMGVPGQLAASAWGSDILVAPQRSALLRELTRRVLRHSALCSSDSQVMAQRMRELGAGEVMVFPFGLERLPERSQRKEPWLFFANRALEALYAPERVLRLFASVAQQRPEAQLVVAHEGSLRPALAQQAQALGLAARVRFVGKLGAAEQAQWYQRARWYLSVPTSDSVAVSVLEAMAHGCLPLLSDLPANRELVRDGDNGLILHGDDLDHAALQRLAARADAVAKQNRRWIAEHGLFEPCVRRFVDRMRELSAA